MTKQFNIRSAKAHTIALKLSQASGKPLHQVVEEALEAFHKAQRPTVSEAELWGPLLKKAQAEVRRTKGNFRIEDMYDPETGLPV